jgi:hypothetical protein
LDTCLLARAASCAVVALLLTGCPTNPSAPACPSGHYLVAAAADATASGPIYVVDDVANAVGHPYLVERAATGEAVFHGTNDGTTLALLAPSTGGVIVVNGGAAALRFDASGALLWAVGYGATPEVRATLMADDRLFVGDPQSAHAFAPDGSSLWKVALPAHISELFQVVADRVDGAWVLGRFEGDIGSWLDDGISPGSAGPFIAHFGGDGTLLGAHAWGGSVDPGDNQFVLGLDGSGMPRLLVESRPGYGSPTMMAFDASATPLWTTFVTPGARFQADVDGNVYAMRYEADGLHAERWDAEGNAGASALIARLPAGNEPSSFVTAAGRSGVLVAGEFTAGRCPSRRFLLQVDANLQATPLPYAMP